MRLALVDPVFSWPPLGGAPLDLYFTAAGLQDLGHEVCVFFAHTPENWHQHDVDEASLPFPSKRILFERGEYLPKIVGARFREAINAWRPDLVFQCFSFFMKPYLTKALADYPQIARYYAYEPFCPRDYRIYKNHATCPNNYLRTPNACRRCTASLFWRELRTGRPNNYVAEYEATQAWTERYYQDMIDSLRQYRSIIVYNHLTKDMLKGFNDHVEVIGGAVELEKFAYAPLQPDKNGEKSIIFMSGRANDLSKGYKVLQAAGEILAQERNDFEIWLTHPEKRLENDWFKPLGWHNFDAIMEFYRQADICVTPSLWEEPFGMVAVEAMAIGRPVIASDVGGLQEIVIPGETGYVYDRSSPEALAAHLRELLDNRALCCSMGAAGRKRVEENYTWKQVIQRHYPALLEEALR